MRLEFNGYFPFIHRLLSNEIRETPNWPGHILSSVFGTDGTKTAGIDVNSNSALHHSAYWRAINLLSSQIASFDLGLFKTLDNGDTQEVKDHPAVTLLTRQANAMMNSFIWKESTHANILVHGNGYSFIERKAGGEPVALKMLDSTKVIPRTDKDGLFYEYSGQLIEPYFMLHVPGLGFDGLQGKAILTVAAESMGVGLAMQKYSADMFANGAKQTGVLTHPQALSVNAKDNLRKSFEKKMKGKDGGTMILDEDMKWTATGIPPDQQQLLQSKQFSIQDYARWFGVPPYMLYDESRSTFNNITEQGLSYVRYTLTSWVERWEAELGAKLLTEEERDNHFWKFNMNSLMRGNPAERAAFYSNMLEKGVFSINEVRKEEGKNRIEGGDDHIVQLNRTTIDKLGENGKQGDTT